MAEEDLVKAICRVDRKGDCRTLHGRSVESWIPAKTNPVTLKVTLIDRERALQSEGIVNSFRNLPTDTVLGV